MCFSIIGSIISRLASAMGIKRSLPPRSIIPRTMSGRVLHVCAFQACGFRAKSKPGRHPISGHLHLNWPSDQLSARTPPATVSREHRVVTQSVFGEGSLFAPTIQPNAGPFDFSKKAPPSITRRSLCSRVSFQSGGEPTTPTNSL
jgi:hypothetical protein